jgi:hypothetical protein
MQKADVKRFCFGRVPDPYAVGRLILGAFVRATSWFLNGEELH